MSAPFTITTSSRRFQPGQFRSTVGAFFISMLWGLTLAFGFLVLPGSQHYGAGVAEYQLWFTIDTIASALVFPIHGRLVSRFGPKIVMGISAVILAASIAGMAFSTSLTSLYLLAVPFGIGWAGATVLPMNTIVTGWWPKKIRGRVVGIVGAGGGVAGIVYGLAFPAIVASSGYAGGMLAIALAVVVLMCVALALVINPPKPEPATGPAAAFRSAKQASARLTVIMIVLMLAALLFALEGAFSNVMPAVFATNGIEPAAAGLLVSVTALAHTVLGPVVGWLYDKRGPKTVLVIYAIVYIIALPSLVFFLHLGVWVAFLIMPLVAFSTLIIPVVVPLMVAGISAPGQFPVLYAWTNTGAWIGYAAGAPLWGLSFDVSGSFSVAMLAAAASALIGVGVMAVVVKLAPGITKNIVPAPQETLTRR